MGTGVQLVELARGAPSAAGPALQSGDVGGDGNVRGRDDEDAVGPELDHASAFEDGEGLRDDGCRYAVRGQFGHCRVGQPHERKIEAQGGVVLEFAEPALVEARQIVGRIVGSGGGGRHGATADRVDREGHGTDSLSANLIGSPPLTAIRHG